MVAGLERLTHNDGRQELRDVASAVRQITALMQAMTPNQRVDAAIDLYYGLQARLDAYEGGNSRTWNRSEN